MEFPAFEDFVSTLSEERIVELSKGLNMTNHYQFGNITAESIGAYVSDVVTKTLGWSVALNVKLLEAYHTWLSQQMSDD